MANRIVHFGLDQFDRIGELKRAGFTVDECLSAVSAFAEALRKPDLVAVAVSEAPGIRYDSIVEIARISSEAPLVLFRSPVAQRINHESFDLVIGPDSDPGQWLLNLWRLIADDEPVEELTHILPELAPGARSEAAPPPAKVLIRFQDGRDWYEGAWVFHELRTAIARLDPDEEVERCLERAERFGLLDLQKPRSAATERATEALRRGVVSLLSEIKAQSEACEPVSKLLRLLQDSLA